MYIPYNPYQHQVCPTCGHCPTCGRKQYSNQGILGGLQQQTIYTDGTPVTTGNITVVNAGDPNLNFTE